jgi:DNA replication licensing factor MCM3
VFGDVLATKDPDLDEEEEETHVYEKHDKLLHGDRRERK